MDTDRVVAAARAYQAAVEWEREVSEAYAEAVDLIVALEAQVEEASANCSAAKVALLEAAVGDGSRP